MEGGKAARRRCHGGDPLSSQERPRTTVEIYCKAGQATTLERVPPGGDGAGNVESAANVWRQQSSIDNPSTEGSRRQPSQHNGWKGFPLRNDLLPPPPPPGVRLRGRERRRR